MKIRVFFIFFIGINNMIFANQKKTVESFYERKFDVIRKQENYYFCGPSVIQCILKLNGKNNMSQTDIMSLIIRDAKNIQTLGGISMLDLKNFFSTQKITSFGIFSKDSNINALTDMYKSVIVIHYRNQVRFHLKQEFDAGHFVILVCKLKDDFIILDPYLGIDVVKESFIKKYFSGNCLVLPDLAFDKNTSFVRDEIIFQSRLLDLKKKKS